MRRYDPANAGYRAAQNQRERRGKARYPIRLKVRYSSAAAVNLGIGYTENISSSGLLFRCPDYLSLGTPILLELAWPGPRRLAARGRVVRSDSASVAIQFSQYWFVPFKVPRVRTAAAS